MKRHEDDRFAKNELDREFDVDNPNEIWAGNLHIYKQGRVGYI